MISELEFRRAVGRRLYLLRKTLDKSQDELGEIMGVGKTAIANYEKGERGIDPFGAFKLKIASAAPLEWLYGGDESSLPPALAERLRAKAQELSRAKAAKPLAKVAGAA